jgi:hypothetical protein
MVGIAKDKKELRDVIVGAGSIQKVSVARLLALIVTLRARMPEPGAIGRGFAWTRSD